MTIKTYDDALKLATGLSLQELRDMPVDYRRKTAEAKAGCEATFITRFPDCGRAGNTLRDRLVTRTQANAAFEHAIRDE